MKLIISGVVKLLTSLDVFTSGSGLARSSGAATNETRETHGGRSPNGDILSRTWRALTGESSHLLYTYL